MRKKKLKEASTWEDRLKTAQPFEVDIFYGTFKNEAVMDRLRMMKKIRDDAIENEKEGA